MKEEIWVNIKGTEGIYQVSSQGKVMNSRTGRILRTDLRSGYPYVVLNGRKKYVHILVAEAFIPNPNGYPQVNHRNENKEDNRVENLEWCDAKYNANYGTRNERISKNNHREGKPKPVWQYTVSGELVQKWASTRTAETALGICHTSIGKCCRNVTKTCGGFIWKYEKL